MAGVRRCLQLWPGVPDPVIDRFDRATKALDADLRLEDFDLFMLCPDAPSEAPRKVDINDDAFVSELMLARAPTVVLFGATSLAENNKLRQADKLRHRPVGLPYARVAVELVGGRRAVAMDLTAMIESEKLPGIVAHEVKTWCATRKVDFPGDMEPVGRRHKSGLVVIEGGVAGGPALGF